MIHHVSVGTNDVERSKLFYDAVLPIVGIHLMAEDEGGLGYGSGTFHFSVQVPIDGKPATVGNGTHIAFAVEDRAMVARFYAAALDNGGSGDGKPGLRPPLDRRPMCSAQGRNHRGGGASRPHARVADPLRVDGVRPWVGPRIAPMRAGWSPPGKPVRWTREASEGSPRGR